MIRLDAGVCAHVAAVEAAVAVAVDALCWPTSKACASVVRACACALVALHPSSRSASTLTITFSHSIGVSRSHSSKPPQCHSSVEVGSPGASEARESSQANRQHSHTRRRLMPARLHYITLHSRPEGRLKGASRGSLLHWHGRRHAHCIACTLALHYECSPARRNWQTGCVEFL